MQIEVIHSNTEKEVFCFDVCHKYGQIEVSLSQYQYLEKESARKRNFGIKHEYKKVTWGNVTFTNVTKEFAYNRLPTYWKDIVTQKIISQIKFL